MRTEQARIHFSVIAGRQCGAMIEMKNDHDVDVGNSLDEQIFINTSTADRWRLSIRCHDDGVLVAALEGTISCGEEPLPVGERLDTDYGLTFQVADAAFRIERADSAADVGQIKDRQAAVTRNPQAAGKVKAGVDDRADFSWALVFGVIAALGGGLLLHTYYAKLEPQSADTIGDSLAVSRFLDEYGLDDVRVIDDDETGEPVLSGSVSTRQVLNRIVEFATQAGLSPRVDVQVDDEIEQLVQDIYRVQGIDAEVTVVGQGKIEVTTKVGDDAKLARVEKAVTDDVPGLSIMIRRDQAPDEIAAAPATTTRVGKTVVLVVDGKQGYVMTNDGSRYTVGAMLPSGHVIRSIDEGVVLADNGGGEEIELRF